MKKIIICGLLILGLLLTTTIALAVNPIKIIVNGTEIKTDVSPIIQNGTTLVPIRVVAQSLGYDVIWNETNQSVIINSSKIPFKQYHDETDFNIDFNYTLQCLKEADYHLSEAFVRDNQSSYINVIMAKGWLSTAYSHINHLNKYSNKGDERLISVTKIYQGYYNITEETPGLFPSKPQNITLLLELNSKMSNLVVELNKISKGR